MSDDPAVEWCRAVDKAEIAQLRDYIGRLRAENERLRAAHDDMLAALQLASKWFENWRPGQTTFPLEEVRAAIVRATEP